MVPCNPNLHELLGAARLARPDQGSCKATGPTVAFTYHMSRPEPAHDIPTVCLSSFQHSGSQKRKAQLTCDRLPEAVAYSHPRLKHAAASCRPTPSSDSAVSSTLELAQSRLFLQGTTPTSAFERPVLAYHGGGLQKRPRTADVPASRQVQHWTPVDAAKPQQPCASAAADSSAPLEHQQQGLAQHPALACRTAAQLQRSSGNFQLSQVPHMADTKLQQLDATSFQERHHNCSSNSSAASMLRQCSVGGAVCNLFPQPESDPSGNTGSHFAAPAPRRAASAACGAHDLTATASRAAAAIDMQQSSVTHPHPCNTSAHVAYTQSSVTSHPIAWKCSRPADPQLQLQQTVAHSKPLLPAHSFALDCSRSAVLHPQLQQGLPYAGQQRVHAGHTSQSAGMPWGPSMMIVELIGKCACMLDLEQIDTVKLTIHLYGRIRSQVTSRKVVVEGRVVGMPLLLAGCLWIASKLEEGRKRIPSTTKMAALASTDRDLIAAVEVHLMDLLSWQPLFGWHSP
ncbi:hypothetical protein WJX74_005855 [Apatococcus lobatus]|uniref:Uncharacterized protein n=1 Tax=Apatococcus lobatus TaxID=904363 RepID=A0AAW1SFV7_9CHLO